MLYTLYGGIGKLDNSYYELYLIRKFTYTFAFEVGRIYANVTVYNEYITFR